MSDCEVQKMDEEFDNRLNKQMDKFSDTLNDLADTPHDHALHLRGTPVDLPHLVIGRIHVDVSPKGMISIDDKDRMSINLMPYELEGIAQWYLGLNGPENKIVNVKDICIDCKKRKATHCIEFDPDGGKVCKTCLAERRRRG